ncbi:MAG: LysM peptidoglycan-binding domain-containing protein [Chloroflexi bacterium]|nr:LysM peptidoglycan-binding domain-containing protein [Chloroflexota bacterium]
MTAPAIAQTLPPVAACGLPAQGNILESVTYTLSADCQLTDEIRVANRTPKIQVTINGAGHTIFGRNRSANIHTPGILSLNQVTIDGGNISRAQFIQGETVNATNVTFTRANGIMLGGVQVNLNNVLFANNFSGGYALGGNGSAVHAGPNTTHTWNNVVLRRNVGNGGAISLHPGATLTTTGCLTLSGNAPYSVYAPDGTTWTDSSTGPCIGTIGNGDPAVIQAPALMACGFPAPGNLDVSATYRLTADCALTGAYTMSENVSISVIGNGHALTTSRTDYSFYTAATSSFTLENTALEGVRILNWGNFRAERIVASNAVNGMIYNVGEARFSKALFTDNSATLSSSASVALAYNAYQKGDISFTDATFRRNSGGLGALVIFGAVIELNGCIHFEGNSPVDTLIHTFFASGAVNDNRDPNCASPIIDPLSPPVSPSAMSELDPICNLHCPDLQLQYCDIQLGAIGLVCRPPVQPPTAYIYRVTSESEGFFKLGVSQPQVEALAAGMVACSGDGRVAVRTGLSPEIRHFFEIDPKYHRELLVPRRYIVISKGPNDEGKVNHVVLDNALDGRVFGIVSTHGGPPAAECITPAEQATRAEPAPVYAPFVQAQAPQPDGSIVHIARPGDTINAIAVAYEVDPLEIIIFNQLENMGRWIYPGQKLLIREAGA